MTRKEIVAALDVQHKARAEQAAEQEKRGRSFRRPRPVRPGLRVGKGSLLGRLKKAGLVRLVGRRKARRGGGELVYALAEGLRRHEESGQPSSVTRHYRRLGLDPTADRKRLPRRGRYCR